MIFYFKAAAQHKFAMSCAAYWFVIVCLCSIIIMFPFVLVLRHMCLGKFEFIIIIEVNFRCF